MRDCEYWKYILCIDEKFTIITTCLRYYIHNDYLTYNVFFKLWCIVGPNFWRIAKVCWMNLVLGIFSTGCLSLALKALLYKLGQCKQSLNKLCILWVWSGREKDNKCWCSPIQWRCICWLVVNWKKYCINWIPIIVAVLYYFHRCYYKHGVDGK